MDGLARAAGAPVEIRIAREEITSPADLDLAGVWTLPALETADYAAMEQEMLRERRSPIEVLDQEIPKIKNPMVRRMMARVGFKELQKGPGEHKISPDDMAAYLDSLSGMLKSVHRCFRKAYPDMTESFCNRLMNFVGVREMRALRDQASGTDWRGNSTGSGSGATPDQQPSPATPEASPGGASTATSPSSSAGPLSK